RLSPSSLSGRAAAVVCTLSLHDALPIYLEECLEYAYEHNGTYLIAGLARKKQDAYVGEVLAEGLPQINGTVDFRKNLIIRRAFIPSDFSDPNSEMIAIPFGPNYEGLMGLDASQLIFDGSYFVGLKAARTLKELTAKDHIKSKIDVTEAVSKAYYSVLVAEEGYRLTKSNHDRLDSLLRETKIMHENGFVEKIDLNRAQVEFNNINAQLTNQERLVNYSKQLLKFQMGIPLDTELEIADKVEDLEIISSENIEIQGDYQRRIEYEQLTINKELGLLDLRNNTVQYLPKLSLAGALGMNAGTQNTGDLFDIGGRFWFEYSYVGLTLTLLIFDGLRKCNKIQQNRINLTQIDYQIAQLKKQINVETEDAKNSTLNNLNNLKVQEENMDLALEVYNVSKTKYQEGVGSSTELMDADNAYKQAQSNYYNALLEALLAKVDYDKALGILI